MSNVVGGRRVRFIRDSMRNMIRDAMADRGWLSPGRRHAPITIISRTSDWDEEVAMNTLAISLGDVSDFELELGSNLMEDRHTCYLDFYAESETLGLEVAHDLRDILRGKIASIGRTDSVLDVYDYSLATPVRIFGCLLEDIVVDRASGFSEAWRRNWFAIRCDIVDEYGDETDG